MGKYVKVDYVSLKEYANSLFPLCERYKDQSEELKKLITEIEPTWDGAAAEAYISMMRKRAEELVKDSNNLRIIADACNKAAEEAEKKDRYIQRMIDVIIGSIPVIGPAYTVNNIYKYVSKK